MWLFKLLIPLLLAVHIEALAATGKPHVSCKRTYRKIGCFDQSTSPAQTYLINDRDPKSKYFQGYVISWEEFEQSTHSLACRCHEEAKRRGMKFFAIRFYGECVGGMDEAKLTQMLRSGEGKSNACNNIYHSRCEDHSGGKECVGQANADYLYRVVQNDENNVNGGYSEWSEFGGCSVTCGDGNMARERMCTNPEPKGEGLPCQGPSTETKACNLAPCPIDGGYTDWSPFEDCSKTCGIGMEKRTRFCSNPKPAHGGEDCSRGFEHVETKPCRKPACAVNGGWGSWSGPSKCSTTCEDGVITYTRKCDSPPPRNGGKECPGEDEKQQKCSNPGKLCPVDGKFSQWSIFTPCSETCGSGIKTRTRQCNNPAPKNGGQECNGPVIENLACKIKECPVDGKWSAWSAFSGCSETCGQGEKVRTRTCNNPKPAHGGENCIGEAKESQECNLKECPVNGGLSPWSIFSPCSVECGEGTKSRTRKCNNPEPSNGGKGCSGALKDTQKCVIVDCPVHGGWTEWTVFQPCSKTCGIGNTKRKRTCTNPAPKNNGKECEGSYLQEWQCKEKDCPVDGKWKAWGDYGVCSTTCGGGVQIKERSCEPPRFGGKDCVGESKMSRKCGEDPCPVDGNWGAFSPYGKCSKECGLGKQERSRKCDSPAPAHGGEKCIGEDSQTRECKVKECPIDGGFADWSAFSVCSKTCGDGTQSRNRKCNNPEPEHGGKPCLGKTEESRSCKLKECPVDGGYGTWSAYSRCSKTCGFGEQKRTRKCNSPAPAHDGDDCIGEDEQIRECKVKECPIDGGISQWSSYSECSKTCGEGEQERTRKCNSPAPRYGGKDCPESKSEKRKCKLRECPVDGNWGTWGVFFPCSILCGEGSKMRLRRCDSPSPAHGGDGCPGSPADFQKCKLKECPIDGEYTEWGAYGPCSKACGDGIQTRARNCTDPAPKHGGKDCQGPSTSQRECKIKECPIDGGLSQWTAYGKCSVGCGPGTQVRTRSCTNPKPQHGGEDCEGELSDSRDCQVKPCPVDGGFTDWSDFNACSVTCGTGKQERTRSCTNPEPKHGGEECNGPVLDERSCVMKPCPVNGGYTQWSSYGACSETCGAGIQQRTRSCTKPSPAHGGDDCTGADVEERDCKLRECPINGGYSEWSPFAPCSKTCGDGDQSRTRKCTNPKPQYGGKQCQGAAQETRDCKVRECPIDGGFGQWSSYGACSEPCGEGEQSRSRKCDSPAPQHGGDECMGAKDQSRKCKVKECPVDGGYSQWSPFSACSKTCGDGLKKRTRKCTNPSPAHGGKQCQGASEEEAECKVRECPVDGGFSEWSSYGVCSKSCGDGQQERTRSCTNPSPAHGGKECNGPVLNSRKCNLRPCPINGGFTQWSKFDECSELCGGGDQERTRSCTNPAPKFGGKDCVGPETQERACNTQKCKVDGGYGPWSKYGECSKTCGQGTHTRTRTCVETRRDCSGPAKQTKVCKVRECPVNGGLSSWSPFTACSKTCGDGTQSRTRACTNPPPAHGGKACSGNLKDSRKCKVKECPVNGGYSNWSAYGACSETCGTGFQQRTRSCTKPRPAHGGKKCQGKAIDQKSCKLRECPINGQWGAFGPYGECSRPCNGGIQERFRKCNNPAPQHGGKKCPGFAKGVQVCNLHRCPINGNWGKWGAYGGCSTTCGGGVQERFRACNSPSPQFGGKKCSGFAKSVKVCNTNRCPIHGNWGPWQGYGACSKSCNGGIQHRIRECNNPAPKYGGRPCEGFNRYQRGCAYDRCPVHGAWSSWGMFTACSKTCGGGSKSRSRLCNSPSPSYGGSKCAGKANDVQKCNSQACAVDGNWGKWGSFGKCSKSCGGGVTIRKRACNSPVPFNGGAKCPGSSEDRQECNSGKCPVNGKWGAWSSYGSCSKTCGSGVKERTRQCNSPSPKHGGAACPGKNRELADCATWRCPISGGWAPWGSFGKCSVSCGGGHKERHRSCTAPAPRYGGQPCIGHPKHIVYCNYHPCKVDGQWGAWSSYGECSAYCDGGIKKRYRYCNSPAPAHGGRGCQGSDEQSTQCNSQRCPIHGQWGTWSRYGDCSKPCGGGFSEKKRACNSPAPQFGGRPCEGPASHKRRCNIQGCKVDGNWSAYTPYGKCSSSCGGGVQERFRYCNNPSPAFGGKACDGFAKTVRVCNIFVPCRGWSAWGRWGACTLPCNGGVRFRFRNCYTHPCPGSQSQVQACAMNRCKGK
ncbi:SCO-spondin-like isoform X2 [Clytia hemisphaerica]|uniref:SCO-spondin-like isoform X2 n=1 Tax=Clytia hemisphaerica TaxID=252671 RepID=UPI0034D3D9C8